MEQGPSPEEEKKGKKQQPEFEYLATDTFFHAYVEGIRTTIEQARADYPEFAEQLATLLSTIVPTSEIELLHGLLPHSSEITVSNKYKGALVAAAMQLQARMPQIIEQLQEEQTQLRDKEVARKEGEIEQKILDTISRALDRNPQLRSQASEGVNALLRGEVDQLPLPEKPLLKRIVESLRDRIPILYLFYRSTIPLFARVWTRTQIRFTENPPEKTMWNETGVSAEIRRFLGQRGEEIELEGRGRRMEYYYVLTEQDYKLLDQALTDEDIDQIIQLAIEHGNVQSDYYEHKIDFDYDDRLRQEAQASLSDTLREAYYSQMLVMIYMILDRGESVLSQEEIVQVAQQFDKEFQELIPSRSEEVRTGNELSGLEERAMYWYERIVPSDRSCSFVDRREIPYSTEVRGFEMCSLNPSNYEIAQMATADLPQGLTMDDITTIRYIDVSKREVREEEIEGESRQTIQDTCATCTSGNYIVLYRHPATLESVNVPFEIIREYVTAQQRNDLRHELAHAWQNVMFERYPALQQIFLELLRQDQRERGKDVFDPDLSLSNYGMKSLAEFDDERYIKEAMAELWSISFNEEQASTVQTELPGEAIILRCMGDAQFFQQFLAEHNIS
ncbi:hypothetical protein JW766_02285 [Candidatus Dojkabacteria bacterium]|nr:hypothetical protein [Candidatus Dojkabacteria bacterium]